MNGSQLIVELIEGAKFADGIEDTAASNTLPGTRSIRKQLARRKPDLKINLNRERIQFALATLMD
jgi:hypothetical protein